MFSLSKNNILTISFLILVPAFLIYQYSVSAGFISPFLGGYLGVVYPTLLVAILISFILIDSPSKIKVKKTSLLIFLFFLHISLVFSYGYAGGANVNIVKGHVAGLIYSVLFFLIFSKMNVDSPFLKKLLPVVFLIVLSLFLISFDLQSMAVVYMSEDYYFSYQYMAVSLFIIAALLLHQLRSIYLRFVVFSLVFFMLFLNGARTEFAYFLAFYVVYEVSISYKGLNLYAGIAVVIFLAVYFLSSSDVTFSNNRIINLVEKGVFSGSGGERFRMFKDALVVIEENPILGSYAAYQPGEYAHSIISLWSDFGLVSLLIFFVLFIVRLFADFRAYFSRKGDRYYNLIFSLSLPLLPILLFAKNHDFLLLWFYLGLSVARHREGYYHA